MAQGFSLTLAGISRRFGQTQALDDVSFEVRAGAVHALVGENGAGKSTLVKVISGIVQPDTGQLSLDGERVTFAAAKDATLAGIHLVHQELALLPHRSVTENVFLGQEQRGRSGSLAWREMRVAAGEALARLGAGDIDVTARVKDLATGSQQMVEIARALVSESRLVILDEPTAALTPAEADRLFDVVEMLKQRGTAFIYISHRLDEVARLADSITVLKDGRIVGTSKRGELTIPEVISRMVGRDVVELFPPKATSIDRTQPLLRAVGVCDPPRLLAADLELYPGEVVGIYGLEGHGQDEFLACLAGARHPVTGRLTVAGKPCSWGNPGRLIGVGVGFVPEDRKTEGLLLEESGRRNITLPLLRRVSRFGVVQPRQDQALALAGAQAAGVRGDLASPVGALSGGNQQKLILGRWLAARARVLLLNQPTRGVDVGSKEEIYKVIRDQCDSGAAAVVVSREITELQGLCDRIAVMSHGRLVAVLPAESSEERILAMAVGEEVA